MWIASVSRFGGHGCGVLHGGLVLHLAGTRVIAPDFTEQPLVDLWTWLLGGPSGCYPLLCLKHQVHVRGGVFIPDDWFSPSTIHLKKICSSNIHYVILSVIYKVLDLWLAWTWGESKTEKIPLAPMGVLAPGSEQAWPSAQLPTIEPSLLISIWLFPLKNHESRGSGGYQIFC